MIKLGENFNFKDLKYSKFLKFMKLKKKLKNLPKVSLKSNILVFKNIFHKKLKLSNSLNFDVLLCNLKNFVSKLTSVCFIT